MDISRLAQSALFLATLYCGATQIKFDLRPKLFSGNFYHSQKISSKKLRVLIYVPLQDIKYIRQNMNVQIRLQNLEDRIMKLDGEVLRIGVSALKPNKVRDFFHYPVLIEVSDKTQTPLTNFQQDNISASTKIHLLENQNLIDVISHRVFSGIDKSPDLQ